MAAVDNGCKVAQLFVGTKSLVIDIYPMKTLDQFVNTLQDVIRFRGAPTKLISDHAQLEISNKVKQILCHSFIDDWQYEAYHQHQILLNIPTKMSSVLPTAYLTALIPLHPYD